TVTLTGVFTDDTGRENRASATIDLAPNATRGVTVGTAKELFATGEKVAVALTPFGLKADEKHATTLLVVRLDAAPASPWITPEPDPDGDFLPDNTRLPALDRDKKKPAAGGWKSLPVFDPVKRKIVSAVPVVDNTAEVVLDRPGAYKLLAVTRTAD